jgi:hypothetical protein
MPTVASTTPGSSGGSRRRPLATRAFTALAAVVTTVLTLSTAPAMADDCPNAALRAQNNSTHLPDCRAYEMVTPVFKEGFAPYLAAITDDGRVAYTANGNLADNELGSGTIGGGNSYVAARSPSGWSTTALAPSGAVYNASGALPVAFAPDLRSSLWEMSRADEPVSVSDVYVRRPDSTFTRTGLAINPDAIPPTAPGGSTIPPATAGGGPNYGASDDLSHVIFNLAAEYSYPGIVPNYTYNLYELVAGNETPRPVGLDNAGQQLEPGCESTIGDRRQSTYRAMSTDGRVIFWSSRECGQNKVWARISGTTTIAVSASQCTRGPTNPGGSCDPPAPALFQGANADGTRVYFTTNQQLVNGDTDSTPDLYECDIPSGTPAPIGSVNPCPDLRQVSGAASDANVQGVTRISDNGSRAYFVATGVLASNPGANAAAAVAGDDNLYVWQRDAAHPSGETTFVGKLDSSDSSLWGPETEGRMAQSTDDGRYLILSAYAPLINHGPQADTDTSQDVYRYDANSGALTRLSTGADGAGGNAPGQDATITGIFYKSVLPTNGARTAISDDGGSAVFSTAEKLSSADANGGPDSYMWRNGRVWLISGGGSPGDDFAGAYSFLTISPSGRDVYFKTKARLISSDVDTQADLYDARVDGGFDLSTPPPCSEDRCQGGHSVPPPVSQLDSQGQGRLPQVTPAFSVRAVTAAQRKRVASTGKLSLTVTTNAPGTLSAKATATIAKRLSTVGSATRRVTRAGTVSLSLTLSKKARADLKSKGKLTVKALVRQDSVAVSRSVSLKLTRANAAKRKASRTPARHTAAKGGRS